MFKYFILAGLLVSTYSYSREVEVVCHDQIYAVHTGDDGQVERIWMNGIGQIYTVELTSKVEDYKQVWTGSKKFQMEDSEMLLKLRATEKDGKLLYRNSIFLTMNGMTAENYGSKDRVEVRLRNGDYGIGWLCYEYIPSDDRIECPWCKISN